MEPVIGSARLFTAFAEAGRSPGADLRSALGPGGFPSGEVIRAFANAMAPPQPEAVLGMGSFSALPGPAQSMPTPLAGPQLGTELGPQLGTELGTEKIPSVTAPQELNSAGSGGQNSGPPPVGQADMQISPEALFQLQYQVGMLKTHQVLATKTSQSLSQSLETTLKQSG